MKHYKRLASLPAFTLQDATYVIGNKESASKILYMMQKEGSVHKIKRDLYTCVNFVNNEDCANRFQIASKINKNSFLCGHSAFEFYGFYNQLLFDVQVSSDKRFSEFKYNDYIYKSYTTKTLEEVNVIQGIKVTSIERTIVDTIDMLGKYMDAEEMVKCMDLIHYIDEEKILKMLKIYNKESLYRKVGYVLSYYKDEYMISEDFFKKCKLNGNNNNKGYLIPQEKDNLTFISEWGLYAYKDLKKLASKGVF